MVAAGYNMRCPGAFALLGLCVLLVGCASGSKVVYEAPGASTIGPRIAMLPVVLETNIIDPANCVDYCDFTKNRYRVALAANDHLSDILDYDVACLSHACASIPGNPWEQEDLEYQATQIAAWVADHPGEHELPEELATFGRQLAAEFGVDSFVLVHGKADYIKHSDMAHWAATLTVSMYRDLFRGNAADVSIDIFSAVTGERLWSSEAELTQFGAKSPGLAEQYGFDDPYGKVLFEGLEAAHR